MEKKTLEELKNKLQKEKEEIIEALSSVAKPDKGDHVPGKYAPNFPDYGDDSDIETGDSSPSEVEDYSINLNLTGELESKLDLIDEALKKMESGEYGKCEKCGKEIDIKRLQVNPSALTCVKCG